jgi:hypothetical protein
MISIFAAAGFGSLFRAKRVLVLENLALRQQLAVYKRVQERPRLRSTNRAFWVWLARLWGRGDARLASDRCKRRGCSQGPRAAEGLHLPADEGEPPG